MLAGLAGEMSYRASLQSLARRAPSIGYRLPKRSFSGKATLKTVRRPWSVRLVPLVALIAAAALYETTSERSVVNAESVIHSPQKLISAEEVKKHVTPDSCWVAVNGEVWDVTSFLSSHPGGSSSILRVAGTEASKVFNPIHPSGTLREGLSPGHLLCKVDPSTPLAIALPEEKAEVDPDSILPLTGIVDLDDFERMAYKGLTEKAWSYYASTADDGKTYDQSRLSWSEVLLRPRILVDVTNVDYSTKILGHDTALPIYISPAALAKLAHDEGEVALCKGARESGIVQCISSNASCSLTEIHDSAGPDQVLFFQLYVNRDRSKAESLLKRLNELDKIKAVYLTVDAPVGGKRVLDERFKASQTLLSGNADSTSTVMFSGVSPALTWQSVAEIKSKLPAGMPLMIKGVSTVEDAILAHQHGATGIVLSTHGGRQLDTSPPPLLTLLEIRKHAPWLIKDESSGEGLEIHIDGGIRRGTDVLKALALGATACGLGRPFLYSLANEYGADGVVKVVDILKNEMEIGMRLLGVRSIEELKRKGKSLVNTKKLDHLIVDLE